MNNAETPMDALEPQPQTLPDSDLVRMHLAFRDVPCPHCGYNLRGLAAAQCPECSTLLRLTIAPDDSATWPVGLALTILVLHSILFALATIVGLANDGGVLTVIPAGLAAVSFLGVIKANGPSAVRWALWMFLVDSLLVVSMALLPLLALAR
jgi:hypothetical protein